MLQVTNSGCSSAFLGVVTLPSLGADFPKEKSDWLDEELEAPCVADESGECSAPKDDADVDEGVDPVSGDLDEGTSDGLVMTVFTSVAAEDLFGCRC